MFTKRDQLEKTICKMYTRFIQKRADSLKIFRKKAVLVNGQESDLSILITQKTLQEYSAQSISSFTSTFAQDFERERTSMKLYINSKARSVASAFMDGFK
jgi:actin related protein 2/3 complex subunit 4